MLRLPHGKGTFTGSDGQCKHGGKNGLFDLAKDDATLVTMTYPHPPEGTTNMMRMIAIWTLILAWGLALTGPAQAMDSLVQAKNFHADARAATQRQVPILVLFTSPTCPYCERAKREYLVPMHLDPSYHGRVVIREVNVDSTARLIGFDGKPTTEGAFARANKVSIVPTVMVFDPRGAATSEAIVGLLIADYYFGYLEAAIDEGMRKMRSNKISLKSPR
jgi:thioredoxin-related protein